MTCEVCSSKTEIIEIDECTLEKCTICGHEVLCGIKCSLEKVEVLNKKVNGKDNDLRNL